MGLWVGGGGIPTGKSPDVPIGYDVIAAGVAVAAYGSFFNMPWRVLAWPIGIGMCAHAAHWQMLQSGAKGDTRSSQFASLTERERQILEHLSRGQSNKTIARALDISHDTVKLHVRHILSKLGLSSRVEAAVFAVEFRGTPAGAAQAGEAVRKTAR